MKKQEIKKLSKDEVIKNIDKLKKDLFNFRFQKINSQVSDVLCDPQDGVDIHSLQPSTRVVYINYTHRGA